MKKMKLIVLALIFLPVISGCCCLKHHRMPDKTVSGKYYYFKVTELPESYRYFLKDAAPCKLHNEEYICGIYAESGWLEGRPIFINAKSITSVAEFDSPEAFQSALKKSE
jgi:hypothetical protein